MRMSGNEEGGHIKELRACSWIERELRVEMPEMADLECERITKKRTCPPGLLLLLH
jgi:hypothetical protein